MSDRADTLVAVGRIVKAFGVRGEVIVEPLTDHPERLPALRGVLIGATADTVRPCMVTAVSLDGRGARMALVESPDRTAAERLAGMFLFVHERDRIRPPAGTFFVEDVVGLTVLTGEGRRIGEVKEVLHMPAHDVYVVTAEDREIMIPAVKEFILQIDPGAGVMRVRLIEGMLE